MKIVGINSEMFISSACLLDGGKIVAAGAEERFTRQKLTRRFPSQAVAYCLREAGIEARDVDAWAISWNPGLYFSKFNPIFSGQRRHLVELTYSAPDHIMEFYGRPEAEHFRQEIATAQGRADVWYVTHHRAHAANGFFLSPFETAAIFTADAQGEFESTTFGQGRGNQIEIFHRINYPHSLGALYGTFTEYLGFRSNSDEWKVMAMASYGDPDHPVYHKMREHVLRLPAEDRFELDLTFFKGYLHEQPDLFTDQLVRLFGPPRKPGDEIEERHYHIAAALQRISEEAAVHLLNWLYHKTGEKRLALSGGFFMNSVFNGRVLGLTPFDEVFISSCPDDSGNCFGAALYLYNHIQGHPRTEPMTHNYFGPEYDDRAVMSALDGYNLSYTRLDDPGRKAAELLVEGKIIGWFQGRMEFGQRALGNRSILADPRRTDAKDLVNRAVKYREAFRPFAPAVLAERQGEYFEIGPGDRAPFMEKVFMIRPEKRDLIPAVVHVDGSGRLQTVSREVSPLFHHLIRSFDELTGVPVVLNTSFNLNGEPIVESPKDAVRTFFSCGMDAMIMGDCLVEKK